MKRMKKAIYNTTVVIVVMLMALVTMCTSVRAAEKRAGNGDASVASVIQARDLRMDSTSLVFTNATDNMFHLSFAVGKDYYVGSCRDNDTMITYALIKYNSKFYFIAVDDNEDNAEFNGSYTDTSFDMLESKNYNSSKRQVSLRIKIGNSVDVGSFTYDKDYSIKFSGYYNGIYYLDGVYATGLLGRAGYYDYFVQGRAVTGDGWYKYGSSTLVNAITPADIFASMGSASIKYVRVSGGHVVSTYQGETLYNYTGMKKTLFRNGTAMIAGIKVIYDSKGNAKNGMSRAKGGIYYYEAGIPLTNELRQIGDNYYYLGEDGRAVKSQWVRTGDYELYFSGNCRATRIYYRDSFPDANYAGRLYMLTSGNWVSKATGLYNINGTYTYFVKGARYKGNKWYVKENGRRLYLRNGQAVYLVRPYGVRYKCFKAAGDGKWIPTGKTWLPSYKNVAIHSDAKGVSDILYYKNKHASKGYADTYRVYDFGNWSTKRNSVLYVPGGYYYFDKTGRVVRKAGWYTINQFSSVCVDDNAKVTAYVSYDPRLGYSIYRSGNKLQSSAGIKKAVINNKEVYYYSESDGRCVRSAKKIVDGVEYKFDRYGRCYMESGINWDYTTWMKRVTRAYLGKTGIYCNVFVANALRYAGGADPSNDMSVRYINYSRGGLVVNSSNMCSDWAVRKVTAKAVLSSDGAWLSSKQYVLTQNRKNFSYDALKPGDIIVYYTGSEPTHVGIYFGKYESAAELKKYLRKLGISAAACEAYVHDWGTDSGNRPQYWILQGGMGSSNQVYISNSAYDLSGQYARKIIHVRH